MGSTLYCTSNKSVPRVGEVGKTEIREGEVQEVVANQKMEGGK